MGHAPNFSVFQRNHLSRHITITAHDAYRNLPQQTELIRAATGISRTINKRRPRYLSPSQVEQARGHHKVQALLWLRECYKRRIKLCSGTIERCKGTRAYEQYHNIQRACLHEFEFQKKALLSQVKKKFHEEQPMVDILHQLHGSNSQDENASKDDSSSLSAKRIRVLDALLTIAPAEPIEQRSRRIAARPLSRLDRSKMAINFQSALARLVGKE